MKWYSKVLRGRVTSAPHFYNNSLPSHRLSPVWRLSILRITVCPLPVLTSR